MQGRYDDGLTHGVRIFLGLWQELPAGKILSV
jgi:hypothetical protein